MRSIFTAIGLLCALVACDYPRSDGALPLPPLPRSPSRDAYIGSVHLLSSLRPTLRWEPAPLLDADAEDRPPLTYRLEVSADRDFADKLVDLDTSATTYSPTEALPFERFSRPVGRRYYWRVRSCYSSESCSEYSNTWWFNLGRSERDFTGDGYADLLVGAPGSDAGGMNAGRAYVYFGGAGPFIDADVTLNGSGDQSIFGSSLAPLGDVNGDGYSDFAVAAPNQPSFATAPGKVFVYFGGAEGVVDNVPEGVLVNGFINDRFGAELAGAGDVNGDGFADVAVSARYDAERPERSFVKIYYGGAGTTFDDVADVTIRAESTGGFFGDALAAAGDVNGDGFADLSISDIFHDVGGDGDSTGRTYVYLGGPNGMDPDADGVLTGFYERAFFGSQLLGGGDWNHDGFADLMVLADGLSGSNVDTLYLYFGGAGDSFNATQDGQMAVPQNASLAYVRGLHVDDVFAMAVSDPTPSSGSGGVYLYYSEASGQFDISDNPVSGGGAANGFGLDVSSAGDFDGDGSVDLIVGAAQTDGIGVDSGAAHLFLGNGEYINRVSYRTVGGEAAGDFLGRLPR